MPAPAHTELAAAERLLEAHHEGLRWCSAIGWLVWEGQRWAPNDTGASETAKSSLLLQRELAKSLRTRRAIDRLMSARGVSALLKLAHSDPRVCRPPNAFDVSPELLATVSGTVDLATSQLRPPRREDQITCVTNAPYLPGWTWERWGSFVLGACCGDTELAAWLQMAVGYTLTGYTREEVFYLVSGPPGSGKGTFIEAVKRAIGGSYSKTTPFSSFTKRDIPQAQRPDLARLSSARMVSASEVDAESRLDEGVISSVTGGDEISACHKYRDPFDYTPRFKLWLTCNRRPRVNPALKETGFWRRVRVVPFNAEPQRADPTIKAYLLSGDGSREVLAWAVEGARLYLADGLGPIPAAVAAANEGYRRENDTFAEFASRYLVTGETHTIPKARLASLYRSYCEHEGIRYPMSPATIARRVVQPPYSAREVVWGSTAAWEGIGERAA